MAALALRNEGSLVSRKVLKNVGMMLEQFKGPPHDII